MDLCLVKKQMSGYLSALNLGIVHQWRSYEASILVGTNTALLDDPLLTNRFWPGEPPIRLVIDLDLRLQTSLKVFNQDATTIIFNSIKQDIPQKDIDSLKKSKQVFYYRIEKSQSIIKQLCDALFQLRISSVLVEGGAQLLESFIDENLWDEARVITSSKVFVEKGKKSPVLPAGVMNERIDVMEDSVVVYYKER